MAKNVKYLVSPRGKNCWQVKEVGDYLPLEVWDTKEQAVRAASAIARAENRYGGRTAHVIISGKDGKFKETRTYKA
jgi:hypothetical protein